MFDALVWFRRRILRPLLQFAFHLFYNPFAFTYDIISAFVSRGHWRAWTNVAIPRVVGTRVLEVPCGTGNLLLDLAQAGYAPVGVDLSPHMLRISRGKARASGRTPTLVRARVQKLPFRNSAFDTAVMTFPPGFVYDAQAIAELRRVLGPGGRLLWVDAGRLKPRDWWSRALNSALDFVSGGEGDFADYATRLLEADGFDAVAEWVEDAASLVVVVTATRRGEI